MISQGEIQTCPFNLIFILNQEETLRTSNIIYIINTPFDVHGMKTLQWIVKLLLSY